MGRYGASRLMSSIKSDMIISGGWAFFMLGMAIIDAIFIFSGHSNLILIAGFVICIIAFILNLISFLDYVKIFKAMGKKGA
jgi:hypothetical protein